MHKGIFFGEGRFLNVAFSKLFEQVVYILCYSTHVVFGDEVYQMTQINTKYSMTTTVSPELWKNL